MFFNSPFVKGALAVGLVALVLAGATTHQIVRAERAKADAVACRSESRRLGELARVAAARADDARYRLDLATRLRAVQERAMVRP